jgi:hypothetical protein
LQLELNGIATNNSINNGVTTIDSPDLKLLLGEIDHVAFKMKSNLNTAIDFPKLFIKFDKTDLNNQFILIDKIRLANLRKTYLWENTKKNYNYKYKFNLMKERLGSKIKKLLLKVLL